MALSAQLDFFLIMMKSERVARLFVLFNISSWSGTSDTWLRGGWLCPKLTNLSSCPQPLPPRTMSSRPDKKWIKMFLFQNSHSCISPPILDVSQNQYFAHRLHIPRSQEIWSVKIHIWGINIKFVQRFSEKVFANNYRIHTVSLGSLTFYNSFNLSYSLLRGRAKVTCNSSRLGERKIIGIIDLDLICSTCT